MKKSILQSAFLCCIVLFGIFFGIPASTPAEPTPSSHQQQLIENYAKTPLSFEKNQGQTDDRVKYLSRGQGYILFLTQKEAVLSLHHPNTHKTDILRLQLLGANPTPIVEGLHPQSSVSNYLVGKHKSKWQTQIPQKGKVKYHQVYKGIDLIYYGNQQRLEYDFILAPGATPKTIRLLFSGANQAHIDADGNLILHTHSGKVVQQAPISYQNINGYRRPVESRYLIKDIGTHIEVGFEVGDYNPEYELVIDPILNYASILGNNITDFAKGIALDPSGNTYVTGTTLSSDFPTQNAFQSSPNGTSDAFVTKLDPSGKPLYSTYLGGSGGDVGQGIAVDASQNIYIIGRTESSDLPTQNAFQNTYQGGNYDGFVAKLNASGNTMLYATYLGGSSSDWAHGMTVDTAGNAYITGETRSSNFPVQNAYQSTFGGSVDVFVVKLNTSGTPTYSTFLGGSSSDIGQDIEVDTNGNAYITGYTISSNFPTLNAFQATKGSSNDAFVAKLDTSGTPTYLTYLGGNGLDNGWGISVDASENVYLTGSTRSSDFPTLNAFQNTLKGARDAFVVKLNASGTALAYATYLGGQGTDVGLDIAVDLQGNAHVTGYIESSDPSPDFPIQNALPDNFLRSTAFTTKFNSSGNTLLYSTLLVDDAESGQSIIVDTQGNSYITGKTKQSSFVAKISPITLSASALAFGNLAVGTSLQKTITITNGATQTLNVTGVTLSGAGANAFSITPSTLSIPTDQSQNITVTFSPPSSGTLADTLSIANNISGSPITVSLSGQGIAPTISLSAASLAFGNISVGSSSTQTVTISNTGDDTLKVTGITSTGTDASLFTISPSSFNVLPSQNQLITVTFSPTSSGSKTASLSIAHNASGSPSTTALSGSGIAPTISQSTSSLTFGNISVGSSSTQAITISNTGDETLKVSGITSSGTDSGLFTSSPTKFDVLPSQSQTVTVTFAPTSAGNKSASLSIAHNASGSPSTVSLSGQGVTPIISVSATSLAFGNIFVGNNTTQTVTLSNTGDDTLKVTTSTLSGSGASIYSVTPTTFNVLPSQNQTIAITATPTTFGTQSATLSIAHNASDSPTSISLTATGTAPDISLSANALSFGNVENNTEKTLTLVVSNNGNADLTVSNVTSSNAAFTLSPTTFTIGANNNQGVGVTFKPTSAGEQSATVTLTTNDPDEASLTVSLTGTGTEPATPPPPPPPPQVPTITFSSQNISFGDVLSGQTNSQTITISNTGNATLSISDITLTGDAFSLSASTGDIAPGQNQQITVTFSPTSAASETGSIAITHNAGSQTVIPLTGTGVVQPAIHIATTDLDFGQVLANTTGTLNLTLSNTGNANLEITNITFTNPRFETASSSFTIAGSDSQAVAILFRPVTGGLNTGTLTITHNASSDPIQINLSGEGTLPLGLQITPASLDFARVDVNGQQSGTLQLENPGTDTLNILTLQTHRLDFQVVQGDSLPISLAPSESRVLDLLFFPRRSGITTGDLSLTTQDSTFTIPLQGEGVVAQPALTPHLQITPSQITFGNLSNTQSDTTTITLSNAQGTGTLFVTGIASNDAWVTASADSFIINPGEQKNIQIIAQAAERTFPTGQISISSNDLTSPTASLTWRAGILLNDLIMVDLDTQTGDQNMHRLAGVLSGDTITVQFFAKDFPPITGYGMFVDYDINQMTFLNHAFEPTVIPGATEQISASNGQVNLGLTSFTGVQASGDAFLGTLSFVASNTLADSTALTFNTITLSLANGGLQELPQRTSVWIVEGISPDFTGDGRVDFRDFLLFGQAFGGTDPQFDLSGDGSVGFPDFIIFAAAFGS